MSSKSEKHIRVCIYPSDIQIIMGRTLRQSRTILQKIKTHYKKQPHQTVSTEEFSEYTGLSLELIKKFMV